MERWENQEHKEMERKGKEPEDGKREEYKNVEGKRKMEEKLERKR